MTRTHLTTCRGSRVSILPWLLVPTLALAACSSSDDDSGDDSGPDGARLRGQLSVLISDESINEAEPNDGAQDAQTIGALTPGATITVNGSVSNPSDEFDVFLVVASDRMQVDVVLDAADATSDLDMQILDPVAQQIVELIATPGSPDEAGAFVAQGSFFVVVRAFSGASAYQLTLNASPIPVSGAPEAEPNNISGTGNYMGTVSPGNGLVVTGSGGSSDFFHIAVPGSEDLFVSLDAQMVGDDFDLEIFDSTTDIVAPTSLQTFSTMNDPESGTVPGAPMRLITIEVQSIGGASGNYTLTVDPIAPLTGGGNDPANDFAPIAYRRSSLASVASSMRGGGSIATFLEPRARVAAGDLIVCLNDDARARLGANAIDAAPVRVGEIVRSMHGTVTQTIPGGASLVKFPLPLDPDPVEAARFATSLAAVLTAHPDVRYAEPNYMRYPTALPQSEVRPNDPFYSLQWHYEQINLPAAWAIQTGSNQVVVAVLDTGSADAAADLRGQIPGADFDMISDTSIAGDGDGRDTDSTDVGDSNGFQPSSFHGAHVAGTIGAITDNGVGVAGVAWDLQLFHVRCLGIGGGTTFDITNAVLYAAGLANVSGTTASPAAHIQNLSLGGPGFSQTFQNACTDAFDAGSLIVAAAGNENSSQPSFPAAYDDVISVAAVDFESRRAPYSNFHPSVDIAAPGGDVSVDRNGDGYADGVLSTKPDDSSNPTNFDNFTFYQGTSMASPHVAGVAALVQSEDLTLTPTQVQNILLSTATDIGPAGRDDDFGEGLVNALAAVQMADGGAGSGPQIGLQSGSIVFEGANDTRRVGVYNIGSGMLDVGSITTSTDNGGSWLSASAVAGAAGGPTDVIAVDVSVGGGGLSNGIYTGRVTIPSNGGTAVLSVSLSIGGGGQGQNYEVFVLAVDAVTFETLAQDEVFTNGDLRYSLPGLDPGTYFVVAGTDEDLDNVICDDGEPLCGIFPSLESASTIALEEDETVSGLDFPLENPTVSASTRRGFKLLRPRAERSAEATEVNQ